MIYNVINLLYGIGLFLFGINLIGENTKRIFGERLQCALGFLTKNRISGMLTGFAVTALIQSSSATNVMTVSFVSAGLMSLSQAVGIVMGANIGTTLTSLLIAFNFSSVAPLAIFLGAAVYIFTKNERLKYTSTAVIGFGLLFLGLNTMSLSFSHLKDSEAFLGFVSACENKFMCVLTGFIMTAIIQSSTATVGILQALALSGAIPVESALYIIFGQNIGEVIPVYLSSLGATRQAKQISVIQLLFNLTGSAFFFILFEIIPFPDLIRDIGNPSMQVSFMHIAFNVIITLLLLPMADILIKISERIMNLKRI